LGPANKRAIVAFVERGGNLRTFYVAHADKVTAAKIVTDNIAKESRLHTDEIRIYFGADMYFAAYETVRYSSREYIRGDVHTNSAKGYFSVIQTRNERVNQDCKEKCLYRYLAEYDFSCNHGVALGGFQLSPALHIAPRLHWINCSG